MPSLAIINVPAQISVVMDRFLTVAQEVVAVPISPAFEMDKSLPLGPPLSACLESPSFLLVEEFLSACGVRPHLPQLG